MLDGGFLVADYFCVEAREGEFAQDAYHTLRGALVAVEIVEEQFGDHFYDGFIDDGVVASVFIAKYVDGLHGALRTVDFPLRHLVGGFGHGGLEEK